jgi:NifU-like protein involved in Fe-S cluster formation
MEYSAEVLRRFSAPRPALDARGFPGRVVTGEAEDRTLHVWVRFELQVMGDTIQAVGYHAYGCPHTVAAASLVAERFTGRRTEFSGDFGVQELAASLDVPVEKLGKLLRVEDAMLACLRGLANTDVTKDD